MKQNLGQSPLGTTVTGRAAPESAAAADQLPRLLETKDGSHWLIQQLDCIGGCNGLGGGRGRTIRQHEHRSEACRDRNHSVGNRPCCRAGKDVAGYCVAEGGHIQSM